MKQAINADSGAQMTIGGSSSSTARPRPSGSASVLSAYKERVPVHDVCFLSRAQAEAQTAFDETCATVDTGCQRSAVGKETLQKLLEHQPPDLPAVIKAETHHFKSINGVSKTDRVACVPTSLGPRGCVLRPAVFEDEATKQAPFLLSLPFLLHCRSVLHLDPKDGLQLQLKRFNCVISLHIGPTGALRVPLHQFSNVMHRELSQAMSELEHEAAAPSCLHESPEERLSRQPRAVNFLRDPQPASCSEHALREAVSCRQHEGVQPERDRLEPDGGSNADVGPERGLQCDPLPLGHPRTSDADLRPGHPGITSSDDRCRARQSSSCCGTSPRATGARRNELGPMGCQAALESPDDRGPRHGDQLRDRLHPDRHAQAGHGSNRESPSGDPVLLSETYGGSSSPQGRTQPRTPVSQVPSLGEPVDPLFLFQLVGTPAILATRSNELDDSLSDLDRASSGLHQGTHDTGEVVEESKLANLTFDDRSGEVRTQGDNLRRVERLCPPGEVLEDQEGASGSGRPGTDDSLLGRQLVAQQPQRHGASGDRSAPAGGTSATSSGEQHGRHLQGEPEHQGEWIGQLDPRQPGLGGVPGVQAFPGHEEQAEVNALLGKHRERQVLGHLRKAERQWTDVASCLCDSHGDGLSSLKVRACHALQGGSSKKVEYYQELFALSKVEAETVAEIYNPNRFGRRAKQFRLHPGQAFDIELGHDLLKPSVQHSVLTYVQQERPGLVIISPPCHQPPLQPPSLHPPPPASIQTPRHPHHSPALHPHPWHEG